VQFDAASQGEHLLHSVLVTTLSFSSQELTDERINPATIAQGKQALEDDGFVLLKQVVDTSHIDILRDVMFSDLEAVLARPDAPFNFNKGNVQQAPPPTPPFLFRDVVFNPAVIALTRAVLGPRPLWAFYSGNTALPDSEKQPVHGDLGQLWPALKHATPAFGLVINIPLVDVDERNASTELWPGTHLDTQLSVDNPSIRVSEAMLESWKNKRPPFQPTIQAGDVLVRDIRLWHAGTTNHTAQPRPMLALIHWCSWWKGEEMDFPIETKEWLQHPELHINARFQEAVNHIEHGAAYDVTPDVVSQGA